MREVKMIESAVADMNRRLIAAMGEVRKERCEGLEADWANVAEMLEAVRDAAYHAAADAWKIVGEAQ